MAPFYYSKNWLLIFKKNIIKVLTHLRQFDIIIIVRRSWQGIYTQNRGEINNEKRNEKQRAIYERG